MPRNVMQPWRNFYRPIGQLVALLIYLAEMWSDII